MGCIYQRGRVYWIKYSRAGRAYFESSGSTKHEDAKRLLRLREGDIARGGCPSPLASAGCGSARPLRASSPSTGPTGASRLAIWSGG